MTIDVTARNPLIARWLSAMDGPGRVDLHAAMGAEVQVVTAAHVRELAATRHGTAEKLGASPTNFLAQAAEKIESPAALGADADAATLTINHPGMSRAFRTVTIVPKNGATHIPIAMNAIAYGRRPREFSQVQFVHKGDAVRTDIAAYVLVRSVTQKQDRTLLPSHGEWEGAAARGAVNFFRSIPA